MPELTFTITNLTCEACVKVSTMTLHKLPGITDVSVDLSTGAVRVLSKEQIHQNDVTMILKAKGYEVTF